MLKAVAAGTHRVALDGTDAGPLPEGDRDYARQRLAERAAKWNTK